MTDYLQNVEWSIPNVLAVLGGGLVGALVATIGVVLVYGIAILPADDGTGDETAAPTTTIEGATTTTIETT